MNDEVTWLLVADERGARLLRGRATGSGRSRHLRLERLAEMTNPWAELYPAAGALEPGEGERRRRAEFLQRYAGELCRWLLERSRELDFRALELFSPAGVTVALRREIRPHPLTVNEHLLDLGRVSVSALEGHPAVFELFRSRAS